MFIFYNPNPKHIKVTDCTLRAISIVTHQDWDNTWLGVAAVSFEEKNMMDANEVWGKYMTNMGFTQYYLPYSHIDHYTVKDFCDEHPEGEYMLTTGSHVIAVVNGNYYDIWDSGEEIPISYWEKRKE